MNTRTKYTCNLNSFPCFRVFPMFWNVASGCDFTAQMVWWFCAFAHFRAVVQTRGPRTTCGLRGSFV